jgi:hypothetical protein
MLGIWITRCAAFAVSVAACTGLAVAQSEERVGLVMALSGQVTPPIAPMAEIAAGMPLHLSPGTRLTFLHYGRCKLITVAGGTLSLTRTEFAADGQILSEMDGPCPQIHSLAGRPAGTGSSGLVIRAGVLPHWPLDPAIVIAGRDSEGLKTAAIYAEDDTTSPLVQLEVSGHTLRFPAGQERLAANGRYLLRLTGSGRTEPIELPFIGAASDGPELIVVLR